MRIPVSLAWVAVAVLGFGATIANAQTPPASRNAQGVAFSQVSLEVPDFDAQVKFWTALGGSRLKIQAPPQSGMRAARFAIIDFPDMAIAIREGQGKGGTVGSAINHIGFQVPDTMQAASRYNAAGLKVEVGGAPNQAFVTGPDAIRVEILQDPTLKVPIRGHHIHFFNASPLEIQAWYAKLFGAVPGKRGNFDAANITASSTVMNLTFSKGDPGAPTKGRALDHLTFNVEGLPAFVARLEAERVQIEQPLKIQENGRTGTAVVIDPWGTRIELIDQRAGRGE